MRIDKKYIYKLLRNRTYLGELSHNGSWYQGLHDPIIDAGLWGRVHEVLGRDYHVRAGQTRTRSRTDALLRGLLFAPSGDPMYPTERYRIVNLMIERVDLVHGGIKIRWREIGWRKLIREFMPATIGAEMIEAGA